MEVALRSRLMYKQSQETRKHQDGVCKHGTAALQSPPTRAGPPALVPSTGHTFFTFYASLDGQWEGFYLLFPRHLHFLHLSQAGTCQWPWGADVAVLWWKAGRCWEIKEWL